MKYRYLLKSVRTSCSNVPLTLFPPSKEIHLYRQFTLLAARVTISEVNNETTQTSNEKKKKKNFFRSLYSLPHTVTSPEFSFDVWLFYVKPLDVAFVSILTGVRCSSNKNRGRPFMAAIGGVINVAHGGVVIVVNGKNCRRWSALSSTLSKRES